MRSDSRVNLLCLVCLLQLAQIATAILQRLKICFVLLSTRDQIVLNRLIYRQLLNQVTNLIVLLVKVDNSLGCHRSETRRVIELFVNVTAGLNDLQVVLSDRGDPLHSLVIPLAILLGVRKTNDHRQRSLHKFANLALQEQYEPVEGESLEVREASRLLEHLDDQLLQLGRHVTELLEHHNAQLLFDHQVSFAHRQRVNYFFEQSLLS